MSDIHTLPSSTFPTSMDILPKEHKIFTTMIYFVPSKYLPINALNKFLKFSFSFVPNIG